MTDRMIRRFQIEGKVDDSSFVQTQQTWLNVLESQMKDEGYIPLRDIDPVWRSAFDGKTYDCKMTVQGVYVGEESWNSAGMIGTKIVKSTTQRKSNQSSENVT